MKYRLDRLNEDKQVISYTGIFRIWHDNRFTFFFDNLTEFIALNDGNLHRLTELNGYITNLRLDNTEINIECFVNISGVWHKDTFTFYYAPST